MKDRNQQLGQVGLANAGASQRGGALRAAACRSKQPNRHRAQQVPGAVDVIGIAHLS